MKILWNSSFRLGSTEHSHACGSHTISGCFSDGAAQLVQQSGRSAKLGTLTPGAPQQKGLGPWLSAR